MKILKKVTYEFREDESDPEVDYVTQEEFNNIVRDDFYFHNKEVEKVILKITETKMLCKHPRALGIRCGREIVVKDE